MSVGYRLAPGTPFRARLAHAYALLLRRVGRLPAFYSDSTDNSYETFNRVEIRRAREIYLEGLRSIATEGMLAIAFNLNNARDRGEHRG
jgi:hypothetical protein